MTKTGKKTVTTAIPIATGNKDESGNEISEWKNITFWGAFKEGDRDLAKGAQMLKPVITTNKDGEQVQRKQRAVIICKKNKPFVSENGKTYVSYTASAFEVFEPFTAGNSTNSYGQATPMPSTVNIPDTTNPVSNEVTPTAENNYGYNPNDFVTVPDDYDELPFN